MFLNCTGIKEDAEQTNFLFMRNQRYSTLLRLGQLRDGKYVKLSRIDIQGITSRILRTAEETLLHVPLPFADLLLRLAPNLGGDRPAKIDPGDGNGARIEIDGLLGSYLVELEFFAGSALHIHSKVSFIPKNNVSGMELSPEVTFLEKGKWSALKSFRLVLQQRQLRSGACFLELGDGVGTALYFHDLGRLSPLAEDTRSSLSECVKVFWPEVGLDLRTGSEGVLKKGKSYVLSDFHLILENENSGQGDMIASSRFISGLASIYPMLQKPKDRLVNYFSLAQKCLMTLAESHGCWQQVDRDPYLNAYLNDYGNPPESMVQMALLPSLARYARRFASHRVAGLADRLIPGILNFYNEKTGTMERWLPSKAYQLSPSEEQKKARVMDSWYLHHPLLQLAHMLEEGYLEKGHRDLFFASVEFCRKVAEKYSYDWPVFYDLDTLESLKDETGPGKGGEKDVAGLYAMVMLKAYGLSGKKGYLQEAKKAADSLRDLGTDLIYQSNNTAIAAEALLELWRILGEERYRELAELCIGNLIRNSGIWDRQYGNSKELQTFFSLFPLTDAPYSAIFEEQECVVSFHRILRACHSRPGSISEPTQSLMAEFIKYAVQRIPFYFPPLVPGDILSKDPKTGSVDSTFWVPVEDLGDGWKPIGGVGQEVYGLGAAFNLIDSLSVDLSAKGHFMFLSYPHVELDRSEDHVSIMVMGSANCEFQYRLHGIGKGRYEIRFEDGHSTEHSGRTRTYLARAGQKVTVMKKET